MSERTDQNYVVGWFHLQYPKDLIVKIPNELIRSPLQAVREKTNGLVAGMPDLMVCAPRRGFGAMFVEMKRRKVYGKQAGRLSANQKRILELLTEKGYHCVVAYGFDEACEQIKDYMDG